MASWLNPQTSAQIQQGIADLGTAFKPPSISEMYVAAKMRADQQGAERKQAAIQAIRSTNPTLANFFETGVADPAGQYGKADIYQRSTQPGATPQSLDASSYALHGNATQTFAGQAIQNRNDLLKTSMTPVAEGSTRFVAPALQQSLGLPAMQQGAVGVGADEYKYVPGANGQINPETPLEGPEGDKTAKKPVNIGTNAFGQPILGTVQKGPDGNPIGVPLPIQSAQKQDRIAAVLQPGFAGPAGEGELPNAVTPVNPDALRAIGVEPSNIAGKQGADVLASVPPEIASVVKSIVEGRSAYPAGFFQKTPYGQTLMNLANMVDPKMNAATFDVRKKMRMNAEAQGPMATSNNALNTAIGHVAEISDAAQNLGNGSMPVVNAIGNWLSKASGSNKVTDFETLRDLAAREIIKVYAGAGGTGHEVEEIKNRISASNSPEQLHSQIGKIAQMLQSKIDANAQQYRNAMGHDPDMPFLTERTRAIMDVLGKRAAGAYGTPMPALHGDAAAPQAEGSSTAPIKVTTPEEAMKLPPGTQFVTPDGRVKIR